MGFWKKLKKVGHSAVKGVSHFSKSAFNKTLKVVKTVSHAGGQAGKAVAKEVKSQLQLVKRVEKGAVDATTAGQKGVAGAFRGLGKVAENPILLVAGLTIGGILLTRIMAPSPAARALF